MYKGFLSVYWVLLSGGGNREHTLEISPKVLGKLFEVTDNNVAVVDGGDIERKVFGYFRYSASSFLVY